MRGGFRRFARTLAFTAGSLLALGRCDAIMEVRIQNVSTLDFTDVSIAGRSYGPIPAGTTSAYEPVSLTLYAAIELTAGGRTVTGQILNRHST